MFPFRKKKEIKFLQNYERISLVCYWLVACGAVLVLTGWFFDIHFLKGVLPGLITMKANTAVGLLLVTLSGLLLHSKSASHPQKIAGYSFAGAAGILGLLTLSQYITGFDFGIDEFFFADPEAMKTLWPPGRFAPITCVNFFLISAALFLNTLGSERARKIQQSFILIVWVVSFQAFFGYLSGVHYSFGSAFYTQIAIHTAAFFILLSIALLFAHPQEGFMKTILSNSLAGHVGRRLLISAILIPPLINWLQIKGVQLNLWNPDFGVLIRVVVNVVFFSWVALQTSTKLMESEVERNQAFSRENMQAEKRADTEARLELITDAVPAFIAYIDLDQRYRFANSAYVPWFGFTPAEVYGKTLEEVLNESYLTAKPFIDRALAGETVRYQNRIITPSGEEKFFEADYVPDFSLDKKVKGFVVIGHDVSERMRSEASLKAAVDARDELLSVCSHELRTPIASMKLSTQMFRRGVEKKDPRATSMERVQKIIEIFDRQLDRLTRLIEEMLDFSRISGERLNLSKEEFDLTELVSENIDRMRFLFDIDHIPVTFENPGIVQGQWDRFRIDQVITNLLSNALKYGEKKPVQVILKQDAESVTLSVIDHGLGISKIDQERIFEPYERAVSVSNISGLGLGLYISAQIVKSHEGRILVSSDLSQGATFHVILPKH